MREQVGFLQIIENKTVQKLVAILLLAYVVYRIRKNIIESKGRTVSLDKTNLTPGKDYGAIARRLFTAMDGASFFETDRKVAFEAALALNNDEFIEVYNLFNKIVPTDSGTLRNWVSGEYMSAKAQDDMITRMDFLNLS